MLQGIILMFLHREKEAIEYYAKCPKNEQIHYWTGLAMLRLGNIPSAIREISTELKLNPKHYNSYLYRAVCFINLKHFKEALLDLDREVTLEDHPDLSYLTVRACIYLMSGDYEGCRKCLTTIENGSNQNNYPTIWREYEVQAKEWILGSYPILQLLTKSNVGSKEHDQTCEFVMEIVKMMPYIIEPKCLKMLS
jgi:tetratricopeptide (TPR) repeat protein